MRDMVDLSRVYRPLRPGLVETTMSSQPAWARLYYNVSLVECESANVLDELLAVPGFTRLVLRRVSDRVILVDGRQRAQIVRALARRGQLHRIVDGPATTPDRSGSVRFS
jgi:hypothetical protein